MASSFHWTDPHKSLPEFKRILRDGGYFTCVWNTRNIQASELHTEIENNVNKIVPELKRVSSGNQASTKDWETILISTGHFKDVVYIETDYTEVMSRERYMGSWRSVNDIQAQAGPERFEQILDMIARMTAGLPEIAVPYKMRSWTAQVCTQARTIIG
jgi:SAM-dependent methyltransferase